jgi:hypothetical protein
MSDAYQRYVEINLPHSRAVIVRIGRTLEFLGGFKDDGGGTSALEAAFEAVEREAAPFEEDPAQTEALAAADRLAERGRALVAAIEATEIRSDRLGQHVRNLFECLGLAAEGADLSLRCGEKPDSPMR